mmetsp:Transcript_15060/g.48028  ORF Transcript_15060/g.48028 Transcript_15060/m.48028 type:complete len:325 (-) Transcript_15060:24-998(-)|eukprot:CAMPEP_0196780472 /NCGR_PEP_ID=MMETSP1104-20130614/7914_1 /TAXON_ID=33652 /ORGANISM="Cafeteria sp., Strain Caron Lab Isolate" /LENGTH=324 /DNA_ID=CAMNT_0042150681 /DNA_START=33 /DNA_END=1007 /DNA_ORIENTATION=-
MSQETVDAAEEARVRAEAQEREKKFSSRFYEKEYPEVDEVVVVNVKHIAEMGAYVSLLEYNNIEGMILLSELSRRRIRSIPKLIRVGRNEVVMVLRVDREKGYIDLSKRRVAPEDIEKVEIRYSKSRTVDVILRNAAMSLDRPLEDLYRLVAWPLAKKFGHAHDGMRLAVSDATTAFEGIEVPEDVMTEVLKNIRRRLTPQPHRVRADVEVTCFAYEGILAIQEALMAGRDVSTDEMPVTVKLIAPPLYVLVTHAVDKDEGVALLEKAIAAIKDVIESKGGALNVKMAPRTTNQRDETELQHLMERLENENREVDGDEADEDEE